VKDKYFEFRDSYCLIASSLDKCLKDFGIETQKMTGFIDHSKVTKDNYQDKMMDLEKYLKADVDGLFELILKLKEFLVESYDIDINTALTSASVARKYFQKNHDWEKYPLYTIPYSLYQDLKEFYGGGRCEVFKMGITKDVKLYYADFTSLYPYVMSKYMYPYGTFTEFDATVYDPKWFGLVYCDVKTTDFEMMPYIGVKQDGKFMFSHFKNYRRMWITTEDIRYIKKEKLGYDIKCIKVVNYESNGPIFKEMIDGLYTAKQKAQDEGKEVVRQMSKIIINSSYGFFGIKQDKLLSIDVKEIKDPLKRSGIIRGLAERGVLKDFTEYNNRLFIKSETVKKFPCANIILAMFVTSYARMELYSLMFDIKKAGHATMYCDTDSVISDYPFPNSDLGEKYSFCAKGKKLGDLTNEAGTYEGYYDKIITTGLKSYCLVRSDYKDENYKGLTREQFNKQLKKGEIIRKSKGINVKNYFSKKEYKDDNINYSEMANFDYGETVFPFDSKGNGIKTMWIDDYERIAKGDKMYVDCFGFKTGINSWTTKNNIQYYEHQKKTKKYYDKGVVLESGWITPKII
jgi:hypothetical protein